MTESSPISPSALLTRARTSCDVLELTGGKIMRFDCYPSGTVVLTQLGVLGDVSGASSSLLARDPDGALFEFVETRLPPGDGRQTS
jgi:hypothetical protein